jgi:hypothetical protein
MYRLRYPDQSWASPINVEAESKCSRAERVLEYTALASDAGKQYRVCFAARDHSDACAGIYMCVYYICMYIIYII